MSPNGCPSNLTTLPPSDGRENNGVWRSHLVPPAPKTSDFMGWDGPTSSHLLPNPQFSWCGTVPPRPTCSQSLSFYGVERSHVVPLVPKPSVFMGWDSPTLSHLLPNPQCYKVERSHLVPPVPKLGTPAAPGTPACSKHASQHLPKNTA